MDQDRRDEIAKWIDAYDEKTTAAEQNKQTLESACAQLVEDCQAIFTTAPGRRVLNFLEASYILFPAELPEEKMNADQLLRYRSEKRGREQIVKALIGATNGKVRGTVRG